MSFKCPGNSFVMLFQHIGSNEEKTIYHYNFYLLKNWLIHFFLREHNNTLAQRSGIYFLEGLMLNFLHVLFFV